MRLRPTIDESERRDAMMYVIIGRAKAASTMRERIARRIDWQYPPGMKVIAEYWLMTNEPTLIAVAETEDAASIMTGMAEWDDMLDFTVVPAITAEQGFEIAKKMQAGRSA
jgi:uncharacterized protein DUF3303